jgi:hypothetical protein
MKRKLLKIMSVNFDPKGQLMTICSAFVKYLRKKGDTMKQCISYLQSSRKLVIQFEVSHPRCVCSIQIVQCIKQSEHNYI